MSDKKGAIAKPDALPVERYGKIVNGVIVNAIKADATVAAKSGFIALPDAFTVGDTYDAATKVFTKTPDKLPPAEIVLTKGQIVARIAQIEVEIGKLKDMVGAL